ncbi:MAG: endopeptidase La [Bacteroidales bacterium]|nr:endopeptidase La [Bacteroidales bacterium]
MGKIKMPILPWMADDDEMSGSITIPILLSNESFEVKVADLPEVLPLLPIRNTILFPGAILPVTVSREMSVRLLRDMEQSKGDFVVATQKDARVDKPTIDDVYKIGTLARVVKIVDLPDGSKSALLQGRARMTIGELQSDVPYMKVFATLQPEEDVPEELQREMEAACSLVKDIMVRILKNLGSFSPETFFSLNNYKADVSFLHFVAGNSNLSIENKREVLEENSPLQKAKMLAKYLGEELQFVQLKNEIQNKTNQDISQQQREYMLHQQMRAIQSELGNDTESKLEEYKARAKKKKWPASAKAVFENELVKLSRISQNSPEYSVEMDYVETLLNLPWHKYSADNFNIAKAAKTLDADHFGLDKVKERILEHLAVLKLKGDMKSPILCLYGPPGVGKTSLGKSIAESLNRKYVRMSLGGLHDESEIRGHRRTYIGAMMGRIMQGINKATTSNPVFILDEIDKITKDGHGDPESALLEVLDPEQNSAFHDNYLDVDYDLSKVMFIATANNIGGISQPLLDRMELIDVSGYILEEKIEIAIRHLLPKQMLAHGIEKKAFSINKKVMTYLIENYTRESGVRQLDKTLASICRKMALKIARGEEIGGPMSKKDIAELLGVEKYSHDMWEEGMKAGVVTGLAWTAVGGEILFIETSASKGKGKLTLTGNLGDVMKESAILAVEYVRSNAALFGLENMDFDEMNFHIHVPEGAIPKDGPSAGITMATSVVSALTGRKVRKRIAMTGEITLRGNVLPVGGIKEKILAAKRAGVEEIILSDKNRKDINEIKEMYVKGLTFHFVKTIKDVIDKALE